MRVAESYELAVKLLHNLESWDWCPVEFQPRVKSQFATSFHGLEHCDLIRIFDVAAHWNAHCNARHLESGTLQLLRQINRRGFAFYRGIGRDNHFLDLAAIHASRQVGNTQLFRTDAIQRRNRS